MLIYVNQFNLIGPKRTQTAFRTIAGWLKGATGQKFTADQLMGSDEFHLANRMTVRTYSATQYEPSMYAVLFSHPDSSVSGRFWVTEIGIKVEDNHTTVSVLLETSDVSTQVTTIPISTRPKLIQYLSENGTLDVDTVGQKVRYYNDSTEDFIAISADIERAERAYPMVIVSKDDNGKAFVDPEWLQKQLLGLAQVIATNDEIDSWEMERVLTRRYSAWGGAINIVYPSKGRANSTNKLLLSESLEQLTNQRINIEKYILSLITHASNGFNKKKHFSPTDVRAKRQKDQRFFLKKKFEQLNEDNEFKELAEEAFREIDEHESVLEQIKKEHKDEIFGLEEKNLDLECSLEDSQQETERLSYIIDELKFNLSKSGFSDNVTSEQSSPKEIIDAICLQSKLTPEVCLHLISKLYPSRVKILDSAYQASRDSMTFKNGTRLLNDLQKLVVEYLDAIKDGGDSKAKHIFGKAYSANESDTVERNTKLSDMRKFTYDGESIFMFKHLRIGTARNPDETIRVHFHLDLDNGLVVIGYCGPHLPTSST